MCDCIKEAEEKVQEILSEKVRKIKNAVIIDKAEFTEKALIITRGGWQLLFESCRKIQNWKAE